MASSSISSSRRSTHECYCKRPAVLGRSTTTSNPGRQFWGCCNWREKEKNCGYFRWEDAHEDEAPTYSKQQMVKDEMNYMKNVVYRDELKHALYPLVAFLSGLVGIFLGFLLAKL